MKNRTIVFVVGLLVGAPLGADQRTWHALGCAAALSEFGAACTHAPELLKYKTFNTRQIPDFVGLGVNTACALGFAHLAGTALNTSKTHMTQEQERIANTKSLRLFAFLSSAQLAGSALTHLLFLRQSPGGIRWKDPLGTVNMHAIHAVKDSLTAAISGFAAWRCHKRLQQEGVLNEKT